MLPILQKLVFVIFATLPLLTPDNAQIPSGAQRTRTLSDGRFLFSDKLQCKSAVNKNIKQSDECLRWLTYTASALGTGLPHSSVSVIFVAHNEQEIILNNTIESLLENTPHNLLKEIIVVDDFSNPKIDFKSSTFYVQVGTRFLSSVKFNVL